MVERLRHKSTAMLLASIQSMLSVVTQGATNNPSTAGGGGGTWSNAGRVTVSTTAIAGVALALIIIYTQRGRLKYPWSQRRRLSEKKWRSFFTEEGKLCDGGVKLLKVVRNGGIDPSIRAEVWPFLLGVYDLGSTKEERGIIRCQKRKEYEELRGKSGELLRNIEASSKNCDSDQENNSCVIQDTSTDGLEHAESIVETINSNGKSCDMNGIDGNSTDKKSEEDNTRSSQERETDASELKEELSSMVSSEESDVTQNSPSVENGEEIIQETHLTQISAPAKTEIRSKLRASEDFSTWQRIIRLDALRANAEWVDYAPSLATVSMSSACRLAEAVGLKDYDHLESFRIFHAARLVAILEAYAVYDPEIGYCQGMSDLLSPIVTVISDDSEAFWCFTGFMKKARHNFRLDEVGIRRQLNLVSKIIQCKDSHLFNHLAQLQVDDCFFVYRMVVVLFRRELSFEQTLCLWEVMWADQTAIRAGIGKSAWSRVSRGAPPTEDLLLFAIAASVLQRRKLIIERYNSMEDIIRECNNMAGHLDVWKLLDDAHNLVMTLHDKIGTS